MDMTLQVWQATAIAVRETTHAMHQQTENKKETQIAQYPAACDDLNFFQSSASPDGKWFAASCGYKRNQRLIVLSNDGTKWILEFEDFLSPDTNDLVMGMLSPKFWSPEGNYLFFVVGLGYSGGGDDCFPTDSGDYGLFRLNLNTGAWVTMIPPTDSFPGHAIEFSPTGRYFAATMGGVLILDLRTGETTQIDTSGVMKLSWSPDGKYLAYSVASCGEKGFVESSSVYVWNASTNQTQTLFTTDELVLRPESWIDNSTLRINGEKWMNLNAFYTIYEYSLTQENVVFTGSATPRP